MFTLEHGYTESKVTFHTYVCGYKINCTLYAGARFAEVGSNIRYGHKVFNDVLDSGNVNVVLHNF